MAHWKLLADGPLGRPWLTTFYAPSNASAARVRELAEGQCQYWSTRRSLTGLRLNVDGSPWLSSAQFHGRDNAVDVALTLGAAASRRPDWLIACPQNGVARPWGAPFEASTHPLKVSVPA